MVSKKAICVLVNLAWLSPMVHNFQMRCCLFQYSGDSDDKLWLYEQNELPITGGKVTIWEPITLHGCFCGTFRTPAHVLYSVVLFVGISYDS